MESVKVDPNDFAVAMYSRLRQARQNLVFSPFSLRAALAMTLAGARGETAAQMREALRIAVSDEELHPAFARMIERLTAFTPGGYEMVVANSIWCQEGARFLPEFARLIGLYYGPSAHAVDFRLDAELVREAVNRWVEEKTRDRIRDLIPPHGLDADTRLALVNAVYFLGAWEQPFPDQNTQHELFRLENGEAWVTPLMHQTETIWYMRGSDYQAVDLGYKDSDVSMLVVLPDQPGLAEFEAKLSTELLRDCTDGLRSRKVELFLPRFGISWGTVDLRAHLRALGMGRAFDRFEADFSGINGSRPPHQDALSISSVFHKAFLEVNEKGTEAAAATAVTIRPLGRAPRPLPVPVFRADHPFLFALRDHKSGAILFLGRMAHPSGEEAHSLARRLALGDGPGVR